MIQCDIIIIVVSRIQLLVNKNFFHLLHFSIWLLKNMRLTTSQNSLHFGVKCRKLRRFLGPRPRPRWGAYNALPDLLVSRGFLPSAIVASRLRRLQFPKLTCLGLYMYMRKT